MTPRKLAPKLIVGNWKMNGSVTALAEIDAMVAGIPENIDVVICPPFTLIGPACGRGLAIGAQDCHPNVSGAHTGCIAADMLVEAGAVYCIVGHSERRTDNGETDADVRAKAEAAIAAGMTAIVCVGETLTERDAGEAITIVKRQLSGSLPGILDKTVVAYEPVWAIGTGRTPSIDDVAEIHGEIRKTVGPDVRILYGGSVKPSNAAELLHVENVDGALVGGASLTASDFVPIVAAALPVG
jgi:triosephosphate isomerase (TIM)